MKDTLISVIIPVYNVERYLKRCIESVLHQTYKSIEILLVDDGSKDNCPAICDEYAVKDKRIQVVHKENGGLSSARNTGIEIARGDFLMFVDSDDYIAKDTCESIIKNIADDVDIVAFRFIRVYDEEKQNGTYTETGEISKVTGKELYRRYINRTGFTHMVCDKAFRRNLFIDNRFIPERLAEDLSISYRLFGQARAVVVLDRVLYYYYVRKNGIMGTASLKLFLDVYQGEAEAYEYGCANFPELSCENASRFLNQSMKAYLKITNIHGETVSEDDVNRINKVIEEIDKTNIYRNTLLFYRVFKHSKKLAWFMFKLLKLS